MSETQHATVAQIAALNDNLQAVAVALLTMASALQAEPSLRVDYQALLTPMLRGVVADYNMSPEQRRQLFGVVA